MPTSGASLSRCPGGGFLKDMDLIELNWGEPLTFVISAEGEVQKFTTIEQAAYWLRRRWPVADEARRRAMMQLAAAQECMATMGSARRAFIAAARSAGFIRENLMATGGR